MGQSTTAPAASPASSPVMSAPVALTLGSGPDGLVLEL